LEEKFLLMNLRLGSSNSESSQAPQQQLHLPGKLIAGQEKKIIGFVTSVTLTSRLAQKRELSWLYFSLGFGA